MIFIVNLLKLPAAHMCIYLGGGDLAVPEHELYRPKVSSSFQEMRGKGVAKHMRADLFLQASLFPIFLQHFPESLAGKSPTSIGQKK